MYYAFAKTKKIFIVFHANIKPLPIFVTALDKAKW